MGCTVTNMGLVKKPELKKHAATIHCSNTLSLLQRKISNALLYHAYDDLPAKEEHEISVRQLCKLIEYSGNNHAAIREALKGLLSTVIEWNIVSDTTGLEDWTASSILASVSLQGPACFYAYSPRMKQLLYSPSMFGKINLYIQSRFKSSYGLALYENCVRYRGLSYTKWFEIEAFRKLMGVPTGHYTIFRDFKRRVLDKSVQEVNTYSDMLVEPELFRDRRQVVKIRFLLKDRAKRIRLGVPAASEDDNTQRKDLQHTLITRFGLSPTQAEQTLQAYTEDFITEKMDIVEASNNYRQGKVKNLAAYLLSALKNNYQPMKGSAEHVLQKERETWEAQLRLQESIARAAEIEKAYQMYRERTIDEAIAALDESEKTDFMQAFHAHAGSAIQTVLHLQHSRYTAETVMNSPHIKGALRQFALQTLSGLRESLISLEQFGERIPFQKRL